MDIEANIDQVAAARPSRSRMLPRDLHPAAWWCWALGLSVAASRTTNPVYLALIIAVAATVVAARRSDAPWALAFRLYVLLGAWIIVLRVGFRIIFGGGTGTTVLVDLPSIPLPSWVAGIHLFGPVSAEALLGGFVDGLRLATMVICIGAANALANPKRLLKSMPAALYEIGTSVTIAVSVFPQLAESVQRVRRARSLRGGTTGRRHLLTTVAIPVLEDALERSLRLAASMDARGYGRVATASRRDRRMTAALMILGLGGVCVGVFALLDGTASRAMVTATLLGGTVVAGVGFVFAGRQVTRSRYRPDRWQLAEALVVASGVAAATALIVTSGVSLQPTISQMRMPTLTWLPLAGIGAGLVPLVAAPLPARPDASADIPLEALA